MSTSLMNMFCFPRCGIFPDSDFSQFFCTVVESPMRTSSVSAPTSEINFEQWMMFTAASVPPRTSS
eukprot:2832301-Alexandrium_andersonii.AAC.1